MATFYIGYRSVLKGRSDPTNTYTNKVGVYSNWDLMNSSHVLDGAPDNNHTPGTGYSPHDIQMSLWFRGILTQIKKSTIVNPGILHPDIYQGRYPVYEFRGLTSSAAFKSGYGHLQSLGPLTPGGHTQDLSDYADLGYIYRGLSTTKSQALRTATLGHVERYPGTVGAPSSFGAFEPFLYKGVDPALPGTLGHIAYAVDTTPITQHTHYGFEHTREWMGVPSAKAL